MAGDGQVAQGAVCRDAKPGKQQVLSKAQSAPPPAQHPCERSPGFGDSASPLGSLWAGATKLVFT